MERRNPDDYASPDDAAFLIMHSDFSCSVPTSHARLLLAALLSAGVEDAKISSSPPGFTSTGEVDKFFDARLKPVLSRRRPTRRASP